MYGIENTIVIDLPVREWDYDEVSLDNKLPYRLLYSSVPQRGLDLLANYWGEIIEREPNANIVITSDYRLWGTQMALDSQNRAMWLQYRKNPGSVIYYGALRRIDFVREQQAAQILAYPCVYNELFCISCSEAQWNGVYPVTSSVGALKTTNMGKVIDSDPHSPEFRAEFIDTIVDLLQSPFKLRKLQIDVMEKARERFNIKRILQEWSEKVFS